MNCIKCGGLTAYEEIKDYNAGVGFWGWHCVFCGTVMDELIAKNRKIPPAPHKELKRISYKRRSRKRVLA